MRKRLRLAALLLAAPLVGACGFNAQTDAVYQPAVGVNVRDSQVDVLGAVVVSAKRGSGLFLATLSNESTERSDTLTGIQGAGDLQVATGKRVEIPATGAVNLADEDEGGGIPVTGSDVNAVRSNFVTLRLTFQHASPVTIDVPVVLPQGPYESFTPAPTPSSSPSSSASPSASPSGSASPSATPGN